MADIVVLSHVAGRELWGLVPDLLEARRTVTFLDVPGFGLSMAGTVALEVSRHDEPASVTAISPPGFWTSAEAAAAAVATVMGIPHNMRHLTAPRTLRSLIRSLTAYRFAPLEGQVPVTVAWGDRDTFTSYRTQQPRARVILESVDGRG